MKKLGLIFTILAVLVFGGMAYGGGENLVIEGHQLRYFDGGKWTTVFSSNILQTWGDGGEEDIQLSLDGNADDWHLCLDDTDDDLAIGYGTTCGTDHRISIVDDANNTTVVLGDAVSGYDTLLYWDGNADDFYFGIDDTDDDFKIGHGNTMASDRYITLSDTAPTITFGNATTGVDIMTVYDGNADDFYCGIDDTDDDFKCGHGSTMASDMYMRWADTAPTITFGNATTAVDINLVLDGNAQDFHIGLQDSSDDLFIGKGAAAGTTPAISIDENQVVTMYQDPIFGGTTPTVIIGDAGAEDAGFTINDDDQDWYMLHDETDDTLQIGGGSTAAADRYITLSGSAPTITFGNATTAVDIMTVFDGNADDFYVGLQDSSDDLVIGHGSAIASDRYITLDDAAPTITLGNATTAVDIMTVFDGNADDFYVGLQDSSDDLVIGHGSAIASDRYITLDDASPKITFGNATTAVDVNLVLDGNAQDFYTCLDDTDDDLKVGVGAACGTTVALSIAEDRQVTIANSIMYPASDTITAETLDAADCGQTRFLAAGAEFQLILPAVSTVSAGCEFKFIVAAAPSSASYTVITGNSTEDVLIGTVFPADGLGGASHDTSADTITFVDGQAVLGDMATVITNGTMWYGTAFANVSAGITITDSD